VSDGFPVIEVRQVSAEPDAGTVSRVIQQPRSIPFTTRRMPGNVCTNVKQTGAPEANESDVLFSTRPHSPTAPLSLERVQQLVKEALRTVRNAPPIEVVANVAKAGIDAPDVVMGTTIRDGRIFVIAWC